MTNIKQLLSIKWVKVCIAIVIAISINYGAAKFIDGIVLATLKEDIKNAKMGVSRSEKELLRLNKEIDVLSKNIEEKLTAGDTTTAHYYTLSIEPMNYINQYVLNYTKPSNIIIKSSSVRPNNTLSLFSKSVMKQVKNIMGVSNRKNLKLKEYIIDLKASGRYPEMLEYIQNIYNLPVKMSFSKFSITQTEVGVELDCQIKIIAYQTKR
jgi:hypothetical protein